MKLLFKLLFIFTAVLGLNLPMAATAVSRGKVLVVMSGHDEP
jgi:hypothetical protein